MNAALDVAPVQDKKPVEIRHSTLKLMFGYETAHVLQDFNGSVFYQEFPCLIDSYKSDRNRTIHYKETLDNDVQTNSFWKHFSKRVWQLDDFSFPGAAAVSFLGNAHRYKMFFNPTQVYDIMISSLVIDDIPKKNSKLSKEDNSKIISEWFKEIMKEFKDSGTLTCSGKKVELKHFGIDHKLYLQLLECSEKKAWSEEAWHAWSDNIFSSSYVRKTVVAVLLHELMHVLWDHITRSANKEKYVWNLATDFSINSQLDWPAPIRKSLITEDSENFWDSLVFSIVKWRMINEKEVKDEIQINYGLQTGSAQADYKPYLSDLYKNYMTDSDHGNMFTRKNNKYANESAEFYYAVFMESKPDFAKMEDNSSGHEKWEIIVEEDGEGEGEGEGTGECDGSGKSKKIIIKKNGKGQSIDDSDIPDEVKDKIKDLMSKSGNKASEEKLRGRGYGGEEHQGFDMHSAGAREEVKETIKDSLKKAGYNPDSQEDIERALSDIPHLKVFGALIKDWFNIKKKDWKKELRKEVSHSINPTDTDYTMSREHRAIDDTFPGKKRDLGIDLIIGVDTSGSIAGQDWNDFIHQIEKVSKDCDIRRARVIQCHHRISSDEYSDIRNAKKMRIKEVGGTTMKLIYEKLKRENNRKLVILFTDGYIDDFSKSEYPGFRTVMFLSRGGSSNKDTLEKRGFRVICQDDE